MGPKQPQQEEWMGPKVPHQGYKLPKNGLKEEFMMDGWKLSLQKMCEYDIFYIWQDLSFILYNLYLCIFLVLMCR